MVADNPNLKIPKMKKELEKPKSFKRRNMRNWPIGISPRPETDEALAIISQQLDYLITVLERNEALAEDDNET